MPPHVDLGAGRSVWLKIANHCARSRLARSDDGCVDRGSVTRKSVAVWQRDTRAVALRPE
jgi:hypothetical protein